MVVRSHIACMEALQAAQVKTNFVLHDCFCIASWMSAHQELAGKALSVTESALVALDEVTAAKSEVAASRP